MPEATENPPIGENTPSAEDYIIAIGILLNTAPNQEARQSMLYQALCSLAAIDDAPTLRALLTAAPDDLIRAVFAESGSLIFGQAGINQDNVAAFIGENTPSAEDYIIAIGILLDTAPTQEARQSRLYQALCSLAAIDDAPTLRALLTAAPDDLIRAVFAENGDMIFGQAGINQDNVAAIKAMCETLKHLLPIEELTPLINYTLESASVNGCTEVVRYLLDALEDENTCQETMLLVKGGFKTAATNGNSEVIKLWLAKASEATKQELLEYNEFCVLSPSNKNYHKVARLLLNAAPNDALRQEMLKSGRGCARLRISVIHNRLKGMQTLLDAASNETREILLESLLVTEGNRISHTQQAMNAHPKIALELLFQTQHVLRNKNLYQRFLNLIDETSRADLSARIKEKLGLMLQLYTKFEHESCPDAALHILGQFSLRPSESPVFMRMLHTLKAQEASDSLQAPSQTSPSHALSFFSPTPAPENTIHTSEEERSGLERKMGPRA